MTVGLPPAMEGTIQSVSSASDGGGRTLQEADVLVPLVDVHEGAELARIVEEVPVETGVERGQPGQHLADRGPSASTDS